MTKGSVDATASATAGAGPKKRVHKKANANTTSRPPTKKKLTKSDQKWMDNYNRLKKFKDEHGHTYVSTAAGDFYYRTDLPPVPVDYDYYSFAKWVERQRTANKAGRLREDRKKLLMDIDFYFNPNDYVWDGHYKRIKAIKEQVGHVDIPSTTSQMNDTNSVYKDFMDWANEQRIQYVLHREGLHNTTSERRIAKLNAIGFAWSRDEDDARRIQARADSKNFKWVMRKIPNWQWRDVLDAIKAARKKHEEMGESTIATYDGFAIVRESDGTFLLSTRYEIEERERKGDDVRFVAFGQFDE